jgi:uncharacterized damage-inducible protein DinB
VLHEFRWWLDGFVKGLEMPRWLFTQAVTHEFHHKGQIVTIARQLGYQPVETDLVTPRRWT